MQNSIDNHLFEKRFIYQNLDVNSNVVNTSNQIKAPEESFARKACRLISFGMLCKLQRPEPKPEQNPEPAPKGIESNAEAVIDAQKAAEARGEKPSRATLLAAFLKGKN